jgi:hypothetical protein
VCCPAVALATRLIVDSEWYSGPHHMKPALKYAMLSFSALSLIASMKMKCTDGGFCICVSVFRTAPALSAGCNRSAHHREEPRPYACCWPLRASKAWLEDQKLKGLGYMSTLEQGGGQILQGR